MKLNKLKEYRSKVGISQDELAKKVNVSQTSMALYESGQRTPRFDVAVQIFKELKKVNKKITFFELWGK